MRYVNRPAGLVCVTVALATVTLWSPGFRGRLHAFGQFERLVSMDDACDPTTFNAVFGPGTCVREGGIQLDKFLSLVQKHGSAGPWHFAPPASSVNPGTTLVAINRGGEVHTFTEVEEFGGGIIPALNELSGNPVVAPECTALEEDDFVSPGGTYTELIDSNSSGTIKFQCCIHPWMRMEAKVR